MFACLLTCSILFRPPCAVFISFLWKRQQLMLPKRHKNFFATLHRWYFLIIKENPIARVRTAPRPPESINERRPPPQHFRFRNINRSRDRRAGKLLKRPDRKQRDQKRDARPGLGGRVPGGRSAPLAPAVTRNPISGYERSQTACTEMGKRAVRIVDISGGLFVY